MARTDGNASLAFGNSHEGDEEEPPLAIRYWQVANLVLPPHTRVAVFSYTMLRSWKDDPRFIGEVRMIDEEVRQCTFAEEPAAAAGGRPACDRMAPSRVRRSIGLAMWPFMPTSVQRSTSCRVA